MCRLSLLLLLHYSHIQANDSIKVSPHFDSTISASTNYWSANACDTRRPRQKDMKGFKKGKHDDIALSSIYFSRGIIHDKVLVVLCYL